MPSSLIRRILFFSLLTFIGAACSTSDITLGGPLSVTLETNAPVSANDTLRLDYEVTGQSLAGMILVWGDSQVDSVSFLGAQSAGGSESHVYDSAGTYTIEATVLDQLQGSETAEITVTINP